MQTYILPLMIALACLLGAGDAAATATDAEVATLNALDAELATQGEPKTLREAQMWGVASKLSMWGSVVQGLTTGASNASARDLVLALLKEAKAYGDPETRGEVQVTNRTAKYFQLVLNITARESGAER